MQTLAILYKSTKSGLSTFHFCKTEDGNFWAFGGITPKAIQFKNLADLKQGITSFRRLGFGFTKPAAKSSVKSTANMKHVDPWSDIPSGMQQELWSLPCSV